MDDELDKALVRLRDGGLGSFPPDDPPALRDRSIELREQLDAAVRDPISAIAAFRSQTERLASCRGLRTVVRQTLAVAEL